MGTSTSTRRALAIPGATSSDNRLQDVQAIKAALLKLDTEIYALRQNAPETILAIDGGDAAGGGFVQTIGGSLAAVEAAEGGGGGGGGGESWTPGQMGFAFASEVFTPSLNFSF